MTQPAPPQPPGETQPPGGTRPGAPTIREVLFPWESPPQSPPQIPPALALLIGETPDGSFRVDPDAGATPVGKLQEAIDRLDATLVMLRRDGLIEPPGADHVSARIAQNVNLMFGNAQEYVRVLREQIVAARDALTAQFDAYRAADDPRRFRA